MIPFNHLKRLLFFWWQPTWVANCIAFPCISCRKPRVFWQITNRRLWPFGRFFEGTFRDAKNFVTWNKVQNHPVQTGRSSWSRFFFKIDGTNSPYILVYNIRTLYNNPTFWYRQAIYFDLNVYLFFPQPFSGILQWSHGRTRPVTRCLVKLSEDVLGIQRFSATVRCCCWGFTKHSRNVCKTLVYNIHQNHHEAINNQQSTITKTYLMNHLQTIPIKNICKITEMFVLLLATSLRMTIITFKLAQRDCTFMLAPGGSLWPFNEAISMALVHVEVQVDCGSTEMRVSEHIDSWRVSNFAVFLVVFGWLKNFRPRNGGFFGMSISVFNTTTYSIKYFRKPEDWIQ